MARQYLLPFAHPGRLARGDRRIEKARSSKSGSGKTRPAPRMSPAAIRVPDPQHLQFDIQFPAGQPQIFVHEGARQLLERRLSQACMRPAVLSVTDNRRSMVSSSTDDGLLRIRIHYMFLDAPAHVQEALVEFIAQRDPEASQLVGSYIDQNGHRIRATRPVQTPLDTVGEHHDLLALFQKLNHKYFDGAHDALITWGRRSSNRRHDPRRSIKLGSYSAVERLIRIHRALDRTWVPRYFVSYIIYHEMLHHVIPASRDGGRRLLHSPAFYARERRFRDYERAIAWEKSHLGRLLRA